MSSHYPFSLEPLSYPWQALEPFLGAQTVKIHHQNHLAAYIEKLNDTLKPYPQYHRWTLNQLIVRSGYMPNKIKTPVRNYAGGIYNHNLYFSTLTPDAPGAPLPYTETAIRRNFGSFAQWKEKISNAASRQFGSGYAWFCLAPGGRMQITTTPNQDTPLPSGLIPLLNIDVWEHAYYLDYQYRRDEYIKNWFSAIDWYEIENNYLKMTNNKGIHSTH
jgi:Fe-Mn family superoxide dismutase